DGRWVVYDSEASTLVANDTNGVADIFLYDRQTGTTTRMTEPGGVEADGDSWEPSMSDDGRYISFYSSSTNLVAGAKDNGADYSVFVYDRDTDTVELISKDHLGNPGNSDSYESSISADGRYVAFDSFADLVPEDSNGLADDYLDDGNKGALDPISTVSMGKPGNSHAS